MTNKLVRFLYILVIGLLFVSFVGFGLAAFYKAPKAPDYPPALKYSTPVPAGTGDNGFDQIAQKKYDDAQTAYQTAFSNYNLYASIILIAISVVVIAISLLGMEKVVVIGDGLTLGGVFTLLYGLGRGMTVSDDTFRFVTVTAGLVIVLMLVYIKYIRHSAGAENIGASIEGWILRWLDYN